MSVANDATFAIGVAELPIASIRIGDRVRKDMGDIDALAASIREHGLLHPPAVTPDGTLIAGHRRIQACARLGMESIQVRVIAVADLLSAERDENEVRKAFTPSEAVAVARAIEADLKAGTFARRSAASKARWARERGEKVEPCESQGSTWFSSSASSAVGMCDQRYRQARRVVEAAEQSPADFSDLVEMMDATGNVLAAHTELRRRRDKCVVRHAALKRMHHRDPNRDIERAATLLSGLVIGLGSISVAGLDPARVDGWVAEIKSHTAAINRFLRSLKP